MEYASVPLLACRSIPLWNRLFPVKGSVLYPNPDEILMTRRGNDTTALCDSLWDCEDKERIIDRLLSKEIPLSEGVKHL
jgi:hypothetical protein